MAKFWTNLQPIRKCIFKWNTNLILKHCQRHAGTKGIESLTWISFRTEFAFFLDEEISQVLDSVPWLFYVGNYNSTDRCDWEKFERRLGSAPEDYPLPLGGACHPPWTKLHQLAAISISINQHQHQSELISINQHHCQSKRKSMYIDINAQNLKKLWRIITKRALKQNLENLENVIIFPPALEVGWKGKVGLTVAATA